MNLQRRTPGFTLIELLLAVVLIGILAAIGIPYLLGVKSQAKVNGQVRPIVRSLQMALLQAQSESGSFPAGGTYTWSMMGNSIAYPGPNPLPSFVPSTSANSNLELKLTIPYGSMSYFIQVRDPVAGNHYFQVDQNGKETSF